MFKNIDAHSVTLTGAQQGEEGEVFSVIFWKLE